MPIGNGRQAAMVFGGVGHERLQLNEDTIWSGSPHNYDHPGDFRHLAEIRKLIDEQKFAEALNLGDQHMLGLPADQASYQPLGDLLLDFAEHEAARITGGNLIWKSPWCGFPTALATCAINGRSLPPGRIGSWWSGSPAINQSGCHSTCEWTASIPIRSS